MKRYDFRLLGCKPLDKQTAKMVIEYSDNVGIPTLTQLNAYFEDKLPELSIIQESAYRKDNRLTVLASFKNNKRPYSETKKLVTIVAGLKYLDSDLGIVWEVNKEQGQQCLKQVHQFDIKALIKDRIRHLNPGRVQAAYEVVAIMPNILRVGDVVKFYDNNMQHSGKISRIDGNLITLYCLDKKKEMTVDKDAVFKVTEPTKGKEQEMKEKEKNYWSGILGPSFARELVDGQK